MPNNTMETLRSVSNHRWPSLTPGEENRIPSSESPVTELMASATVGSLVTDGQ